MFMDPIRERQLLLTRRHFFGRMATGIGVAALGSLFNPALFEALADETGKSKGLLGLPHFTPKARRVIYLFMAGGPSQMELLDYKPSLEKLHETELPDSIRMGQRITTMTSGQKSLPVVKSIYKFRQYGKAGAWVSELLPHIGGIVDEVCVVKTVNTEAINHDPAITFIQTGFQQPGRPCMGAWLSYGLGSANQNLPTFIVMISNGKESVLEMYGPDVKNPGSFAYNCLLARRMAERGVRFIQLYHRGWDQHGNLPKRIKEQCEDTDQPSAALVKDLKQRGLLDDTLVIWGGEFGRTVYCQGKIEKDNYGRDHHGRCYSIWMAGGGIKPGISYGRTDDFCYNAVENPVHIHDLNATVLRCFGVDHEKLTYRFQGRDFRLTDIHGEVVKGILA